MKKILNCTYSFMDNYAQHAGLSILSLFDNNKEADEINVYVIDYNIGDENHGKLEKVAAMYQRRIFFVNLELISKKMDVSTNFCRSTYGKLFLSQIEEVDLMFSFDCDTIVSGSLMGLLDVDMTDTLVAGVQDTVNPYFVHKIGMTNGDRYINCGGVILLNLKLWRDMGIEKKCIDYVMSFDGNPPFVDQGTINHVCKDKKKILPPEYNLINPMFMYPVGRIKRLFKMKTYYSQAEIEYAMRHPKVIHFTGELYNRPWYSNCDHPMKQVYLDYLATSPWRNNALLYGRMSKNCRIQKWIYDHCPFFVYEMMVRFIHVRHKLQNRVM
ncbi:glycosyltransferase family 8 protein [Bacteroides intestinalis]|jgi:glycosyltransferase family 8|nr:glycosyltransferase family 8 protein [Bacteroides intestinalis]